MEIKKTNLKDTGAFSPMFLKYMQNDEVLAPFVRNFPTRQAFEEIIARRRLESQSRSVLLDVLLDQYGPHEKSSLLDQNIFSLTDSNTYTVTTGHQLNIFTGPLYFIFKIVTTINLARSLAEHYPGYRFVPVYWMASEDHDFEEINHFHLFGKKHVWETQQTGPVGRFAPQSLNVLMEQLPEAVPFFEKAYLDSSTLSQAVCSYVNHLFGTEGLVVIDADDSRLKKLFTSVMKADIIGCETEPIVTKTNEKLVKAGFEAKAHAREINFFYLNGLRERIEFNGDRYQVLNTELSFSKEELEALIDQHPEKFSPNVILRPVYQETILPNIAYIGGPAEIIYWLQLKEMFDHYQVSFPLLMPRNFGMIVNKSIRKKIEKAGLTPKDLFKDGHQLKAEYLDRNDLNQHILKAEREQLMSIFEGIKQKAATIDKSLEGFVGAETARVLKEIETIEKRLKKAQETANETTLTQLDSIKDKLFPEGGLQERHENFLNFYLNNPELIHQLLQHFDPFDTSFYQIWE